MMGADPDGDESLVSVSARTRELDDPGRGIRGDEGNHGTSPVPPPRASDE